MDAHPYGGGGNVNVDSCETCGLIWLDGGELRRIVAAPDHESWDVERRMRDAEDTEDETPNKTTRRIR